MKNILSEVGHFFFLLVISLAIVLPIRAFVVQPFLVKGGSMIPNFHSYDYLFVERVSYYFRQPQRGEVIVFRFPHDEREYFIKRVIGLPGERVSVHSGKVSVTTTQNKQIQLKEPYLGPAVITPGESEITLRENEYFVLGDNRGESYDSRHWGAVPKNDIVGKVFLRVWPPAKAQAFFGETYEPSY